MPTASLGCGEYRVFVFPRGGYQAVSDITYYRSDRPLRELQFDSCRFSRILRQTSTATVELVDECWAQLEDVVPLEHELAIYRNNIRVWSGPLTSIKGSSQNSPVTLEARDISWWLSRRVIHATRSFTNTDAAAIFSYLFQDAMVKDSYNPGMKISWSNVGIPLTRYYPKNTGTNVLDLMGDLASAGVPWYALDRYIIAGGLVIGNTPVAYLSDRDFVESISWEINGFEVVNRMYAATSGDGSQGPLEVGIAQNPSSIATYSLLEDFVENGTDIFTLGQAQVAAAKELVDVQNPVLTYSTSALSSDAQVEFTDLIPGNLIELTFEIVNYLFSQNLKLATVEVDFSTDGESIQLGLLPMSDEDGTDLIGFISD